LWIIGVHKNRPFISLLLVIIIYIHYCRTVRYVLTVPLLLLVERRCPVLKW